MAGGGNIPNSFLGHKVDSFSLPSVLSETQHSMGADRYSCHAEEGQHDKTKVHHGLVSSKHPPGSKGT